MKIDEFLSNLPADVISGSNININENVFRNIFRFSNLGRDDTFYYIGFGNNVHSLKIAIKEFAVKKVVGIDQNEEFIRYAQDQTRNIKKIEIINRPIEEINLSEASILFYWFNDFELIDKIRLKIEKEMKFGSRFVTLLSPPGLMLPSLV